MRASILSADHSFVCGSFFLAQAVAAKARLKQVPVGEEATRELRLPLRQAAGQSLCRRAAGLLWCFSRRTSAFGLRVELPEAGGQQG